MRKNIQLTILLIFSVFCIHAQSIFFENFDNGLGQMTAIDNDGFTVNQEASEFGSNWQILPPFRFGNTSAAVISNSWFNPSGRADDWLISPEIEIKGNAVLNWEAVALEPAHPDSYEVLLSTDGPSMASFNTLLLNVNEENSGEFTRREVDLSAYSGQKVWLAFHNNSNDKLFLVLDNISVRIPGANDIRLESITLDKSTPVVPLSQLTTVDGQRTMNVNMTNYGFEKINSVKLSYSINGMPQLETVDVDLNPGESYTYVSPSFNATPGNLVIDVTATEVNGLEDANMADNSLVEVIGVYPPVPDFVYKDSDGKTVNMHSLLADGKSVILDFMTSDCGACASSTGGLNSYYINKGAGEEDLEVISLSIEPTDTDETLNTAPVANWGATYSQVSYNAGTALYWSHFSGNLGHLPGGQIDDIPFFVMICPNTSNPAYSEVVATRIGSPGTAFGNSFNNALNACLSVDVDDIDIISRINAFPNPNSSGNLTLEFRLDENATLDINILNLQGQIIKAIGTRNYSIGNNAENLDISELDSGMYFLQITKDRQVSNVKFTVIK